MLTKALKKPSLLILLTVSSLGLFILSSLAPTIANAAPATFTVTNTDASGAGSLAWAINEANTNANPADQDIIQFNIASSGNHTITPSSQLVISESLLIDGYTQDDATPNTNDAPEPFNGIVRIAIDSSETDPISVTADDVTIQGLSLIYGETGNLEADSVDNLRLYGNYFDAKHNGLTIGKTTTSDKSVIITDSTNSVIGGSEPEQRNIFGFCSLSCLELSGDLTSDTVIKGNYIGLGSDGITSLDNYAVGGTGGLGIEIIDGVDGVTIGGTNTEDANSIEHNYHGAISAEDSNDISILGNRILFNWYVDIHGKTANGATSGVFFGGVTNSIVGSSGGGKNIISGNFNGAVKISESTTTEAQSSNIRIEENNIGVMGDGTTPFPNKLRTIDIEDETSNVRIANNIIHGTTSINAATGHSVNIVDDTERITVSNNSIYGNQGLGIRNVSTNSITAPSYSSATEDGGDTDIEFSLFEEVGDYRIEFFSNSELDDSGAGEGETYLGYKDITKVSADLEQFSHTLTGTGHQNISLTATKHNESGLDDFGMTSPFGGFALEADLQAETDDGITQIHEYSTGHEITQTITNLGPSTVTDITFDVSEECFSTTSTTVAGTATDTGNYSSSAWSGVLESGQAIILTITGDITCPKGDDLAVLNHTADEISNNGVDVNEYNDSNDEYSNYLSIVKYADIQATTTDNLTEIFDDATDHEIVQTITNLGPGTITDMDFVLHATNCFNIGSISESGTATDTGTYAANSWSGELRADQTLILTFTGDVSCSSGNSVYLDHYALHNSLEDDGEEVYEQNSGGEDYNDSTAIIDKVTDFVVTQELDNIDDIAIGETLNYTYTLTNNGPHTADISGFDGSGPNGLGSNVFVMITPFELNFIPDSSTNSDLDCGLGPIDTNHAMASPVFNTHPDHDVIYCAYVGASPRNIASGGSISTTISYEVDATSDLVFTNNVITGWLMDDPDIAVLSDPSALGGNGNFCDDPPMDIIDCYVGEEIDNVAVSLPVADFTIEKEMVAPFDITPGQTVQYDVTLTNRGPMPVNLNTLTGSVGANSVFADLYPASDLAYDDNDNADIFCNDLGAPASNFTGPITADHPDHGFLVCVYIGAGQVMEADDSITIRLDFTVQVGASQSFTNYVAQAYTGFFIDSDAINLSNEFGSATEDQLDEINNDNFDKITTDDGDKDGISDSIEDNGPNSGDANDDGTADSEQANVASYVNSVTGKRVVLEVASECSVYTSGVNQESANSVTDSGYQYPLGLLAFEINCEDDGFTADITKYYFDETNLDYTLRKFHSNDDSYSTVASYTLGQTEIDSTNVLTVDYQVTDGGDLDTDESVNRIIVDPAGLGVVDESAEDNDGGTTTIPSSITSFLADTGAGAMTAKIAAIALLVSGGALVLKRWLRDSQKQ